MPLTTQRTRLSARLRHLTSPSFTQLAALEGLTWGWKRGSSERASLCWVGQLTLVLTTVLAYLAHNFSNFYQEIITKMPSRLAKVLRYKSGGCVGIPMS